MAITNGVLINSGKINARNNNHAKHTAHAQVGLAKLKVIGRTPRVGERS